MAREVIAKPPPGDSCTVCWGAGKAFGATPTPSVVTAVFSDIVKGAAWIPADGEPPNGTYLLDQALPCRFSGGFGPIGILLDLGSASTLLRLNTSGIDAFFAFPSLACQQSFVNESDPAVAKFGGGEARVYY